jgi:hypothetical protein
MLAGNDRGASLHQHEMHATRGQHDAGAGGHGKFRLMEHLDAVIDPLRGVEHHMRESLASPVLENRSLRSGVLYREVGGYRPMARRGLANPDVFKGNTLTGKRLPTAQE